LKAAGIEPPYVLVAHSFGALVARAYAYFYPDYVKSLVLLDPVSICNWANCSPAEKRRLRLGVKLSRRGAFLARFGIVRIALLLLTSGARKLPKLIGRVSAGPGNSFLERIIGEVRKLPPAVLPAVRAHWSRPDAFLAMADYLEALPGNAGSAVEMPFPADVPVTVLSAANATAVELEERDEWAATNPSVKHVRLTSGGHWLPLDCPEMVTATVRDTLTG
jgi:pimeloyl-ACP methyl ester carboxylesterase